MSRPSETNDVQVSDRRAAGSVLLVANYAPDVGFAWWLMENFWVQFAEQARRRALTPIIAYPEVGPLPETIVDAKIETVTLPFPGRGFGGLIKSLRFLRRRRVKCIYFTDRAFSSAKYALFRLLGVKLIINHDHTPGDRPAVQGLKRWLKAAWRRLPWINCDLQLCVSPLIKRRAIDNACVPEGRLAVVQNGIPPIECDGDRHYAHRQFDIPPGAAICISSGRANPYKRIDFVIEVARRCVVEQELENLYFLYCGDGPDMARLRTLAENGRLGSRFVFAGTRRDMRQLLCSSDFALHAARGEAFSLAIIEYMSAGLAVLVPDIPSVCQAIRHRENGLVYADGNAADAANQLAKLVADREYAARLADAASADARSCYALERMNGQFQGAVSEALQSLPALARRKSR